MLNYDICRNPNTGEEWFETDLRGKDLLITYLLNKGTAFTYEERIALGLLGKLPARIESLEEQLERAYEQYKGLNNDLQKHIYLNNLQNENEILFYKLVIDHLEEMIPIIYTPVVSQAVQKFSQEYRQPRGLYISFPDQDQIPLILENRTHPEVSVIVVTDGERVLGIGDQGIGAIDISISKLMMYTMCGGIDPYHTLPIVLDVGTNNQALLNDPLYLGWRHPRIHGDEYDQFIEKFVNTVKIHMPNTFLHWEDFGRDNARRILDRYKTQLCTFNDDMQGSAVVTVAALLTAMKRIPARLCDQKVVIFGAGTAGVGIADHINDAMTREGLTEENARERIWLVDRNGLIGRDMQDLLPFQIPYAKTQGSGLLLEAVIQHVKPSILIGCSTVPGAFTENIVRTMTEYTPIPIIFPLSNPTELSEAVPEDLITWTKGKALIATGSPFGQGIAQCNNAFSFPGIGLGLIASRAQRLTNNMLWAGCLALSECAPEGPNAPLLPVLKEARKAAIHIAKAIGHAAQLEGVSELPSSISIEKAIQETVWEPYYRAIRPRAPEKKKLNR